MTDAGSGWLELLDRWPGDPFWVDETRTVSRGELRDEIADQTTRLRQAGRRAGDRLALDAAPDFPTIRTLLAALSLDLVVLLVPRREPPAVREALIRCAGARCPDPTGGMVWIRSSGSLGNPRWIIHTPRTLLAGAAAVAAHLDFGPGARWRLLLPLDHVGGLSLVFRALAGGGAVSRAPGETHRSLVATQLRRLIAGGVATEPGPLRCLLLGGGPVPVALRRDAIAAGLPLVVSYGLSETGAVAAASSLDDDVETLCREHYAGRPLLPDSVSLGPDGGIRVAGPALCPATADNEGVVAPLDLVDGWLPTGDLGRLDQGRLLITGRRDNVMISGGEKLPAEELEAALLALGGIEDAVVVPVADPEYGQRPVAFVQWADGQQRTRAAVVEELTGRVAAWKLPVALWALPLGGSLKPDRAALRKLAEKLVRS